MQTMIYRIKGTPIAILKNSRASRKTIDPYKQAMIDAQMQLINQHDNKPLLTGPWMLEAHFLFDCKTPQHLKHTESPSLTQLLRFIDEIARGVIYTNECIIIEMKTYKDYSHTFPETTLIFNRK